MLIALYISTGAAPGTDGAGLPWLWIGIGIAVLILAAIVMILFRAGAELSQEIYLVVTEGDRRGETIKVTSSYTTIGSGGDNDVVLDEDKISQHHARLTYGKGKLKVADTNSLYGTYLNGERIEEAVCAHGDSLKFGPRVECRIEMDTG
jgi:pSer/pThr/pTyr-binding forkhead associated (FHA) protein